MTTTLPRAVFDCVVFLQAAGRPASPARACFRLIDAGLVELCISDETLAELRDILSRSALRRKFPDLTPEWVETFSPTLRAQGVGFFLCREGSRAPVTRRTKSTSTWLWRQGRL